MIPQNMINCPREKYLKALDDAEKRCQPDERARLHVAAQGLFRHMKHGRQIHPRIWLQALRAHLRGNIALSGVLWSRPSTLKAWQDAYWRQGEVLGHLFAVCPVFFADMLVSNEDHDHVSAAAE